MLQTIHPTVTRIDTAVSDLFFNHDLSSCRVDAGDGTSEWDMKELYETAESFSELIETLTGVKYHKTDIVADLFNRM